VAHAQPKSGYWGCAIDGRSGTFRARPCVVSTALSGGELTAQREILAFQTFVLFLQTLYFQHQIFDKKKRAFMHFRRLTRQAHDPKLLHAVGEIGVSHAASLRAPKRAPASV
jgi:hypothetical protein